MITPKEKARELVSKHLENVVGLKYFDSEYEPCTMVGYMTYKSAIKFALNEVKEILKINHPYEIVYSEYKDNVLTAYTQECYWKQVKQEIEAL
jgi:hypothetical protein